VYGADLSVFVHLDARKPGVVVPEQYKQSYQLILQFGLFLPVPIRDLKLDQDQLSATLTFNHEPFHCVVPWSAIFFMAGEERVAEGFAWPRDCPGELLQRAHHTAMEEAARRGAFIDRDSPQARENRKRSLFSIIDGSGEAVEGEQTASPSLHLVEPEEDNEE
jgi:stringent starvation protein B